MAREIFDAISSRWSCGARPQRRRSGRVSPHWGNAELFTKTVISTAVALTLVLGATMGAQAASISGKWNQTTFGSMSLKKQGGSSYSGRYSHEGGRIYDARLKGKVLRGYWYQDDALFECDEPLEDDDGEEHYYWGKFKFTFDSAAEDFSGTWDYCGTNAGGSWVGSRD